MNVEHYDVKFKKKFGQNFLRRHAVVERIADICPLTSHDLVIEVGPGGAILTQELAKRSGWVLAYEIDEDLKEELYKKLNGYSNVKILFQDFLTSSILNDISSFSYQHLYFVSNVPYYITTPIMMKIIDSGLDFEKICMMVQKEVAARLCSTDPAQCGAVTLAVNYYAAAKRLFTVSAGSFSPPPKVDSAVIKLTPYDSPPVDVCDEKLFFDIIRAAFGQRRKTLANALSSAFGFENRQAIAEAIAAAGTDPNTRGERLSLEEFAEITKKINNINL